MAGHWTSALGTQGSFKVALIKTEGSRFLIARLLRSGPRTHERCAWSGTDTRREGGACMHSLLIKGENDHRRRTPEPSATNRKLTALEHQRAKLVAIEARGDISNSPDVKDSQRPSARLPTVDEVIGFVRRTVHRAAELRSPSGDLPHAGGSAGEGRRGVLTRRPSAG